MYTQKNKLNPSFFLLITCITFMILGTTTSATTYYAAPGGTGNGLSRTSPDKR